MGENDLINGLSIFICFITYEELPVDKQTFKENSWRATIIVQVKDSSRLD